MSAVSISETGKGRLGVAGVLDFSTVAPLVAEAERLFPRKGGLQIDLQGVSAANSAALALMLEWLATARRRNLSLRFRNVPESLTRLATLTNLTGVLPVVDGGA